MRLIYNIFILLYRFGVSFFSIWNKKAAQWIEGRNNLFKKLESSIDKNDTTIWMHCASAGEFEQGKPVIESLKEHYPDHKILVTFFSPSGYASGKKYKGANYISYLPLDTKSNAQNFINIINPKLVIFVKYEYWYHHLKAVKDRQIPLIIISAIFREKQVFFKPYGGFYKQMLHFFNQIFIQDETSFTLLKKHGINHCKIADDTRFDRVLKIATNPAPVDFIEEFIKNKETIIAGSTWPDDEKLFLNIIEENKDLKLIIAPHEITESHTRLILSLFPNALLYSKISEVKNYETYNVLIIDNVGMLSKLYQYATITYIGGGFNKSGIHNTLEAAVYGKPVLFGPNYQKFKEARDLINIGAAYTVANEVRLKNKISQLLANKEALDKSSNASKNYVLQNAGATGIILSYIQENRLLTK